MADTPHVGYTYRRTDPETGMNQREVDVYRAFERAIDSIISRRPDVVLHSGTSSIPCALPTARSRWSWSSCSACPTGHSSGAHRREPFHPRLARETGSVFRLFEHLDGVHPFLRTPGFTARGFGTCS